MVKEGNDSCIVSVVKQNLSIQKPKKIEFKENQVEKDYPGQLCISHTFDENPQTKIIQNREKKKDVIKPKTKKVNKIQEPTRFLPDTTFSNVYGKPVYHPGYGRCHTKTVLPSEYMQTYNINPQSGSNQPEFAQTFQSAVNQAKLRPQTSRSKQIINKETIYSEIQNDSGIFPKKTEDVLNEIQATKLRKSLGASKKQIIKPALPRTSQKASFKKEQKQPQKLQKPIQEPIAIIYEKPGEDEDAKLLKQFQQIQEQKIKLSEQEKSLQEKLKKQLEQQQVKENELVEADKEKYKLIKKLKQKKQSITKKVNQTKQFNSKEEKLEFQSKKLNELSNLGRSLNMSQTNFQQGLSEIEINPKFYRCLDKQYLDKIPAAGKQIQKGESIWNNSDFELKIAKKQNA